MATIDNGKQEIGIHYLQDVRSISANKLIEEITPIGALQSYIELSNFSGSLLSLTIKKGTTVVFGAYFNDNGESKNFPVKIRLNADVTLSFDISSYISDNALSLFASWSYNLNINDKYSGFSVESITKDDLLYQTALDDSAIRLCNVRRKNNSLPWGASNIEISYDGVRSLDYFKSSKDRSINYEVMLTYDKKGFVCLGYKDFIKTSFISLPFVNFSDYATKTIPNLTTLEPSMVNKRWITLPSEVSGLVNTNVQVDVLYVTKSFLPDSFNTESILQWSSKNLGAVSLSKDTIHSALNGISFDDLSNDGVVVAVIWRTKTGGTLPDTVSSDNVYLIDSNDPLVITPVYPSQINIPIYEE